ncbi:uncharacterized protein N7459_006918 [Penicillium hispanicum]|uniref:uncharacterized protein n=1 Tax=Penicillium hispanicum TaxID=1080232 RepID=UPI00254267A2|nr:uncharacterized protein N7459_006918 [Penicillium hispanicum]KAJ5577954.1 hypothetical protein N7459_006918 [Penicillium hispanicum]
MSGSSVEQASGARNHHPPAFGRQSSAPTDRQSPNDSSSFEVSPIAPFPPSASLFDNTYSSLRSGLESHSQSQSRSVSTNDRWSGPSDSPAERVSPDPDDYYRQRGSLAATAPNATGSFGDVNTGASNSMATGYSKVTDKVSPVPANHLDPSRGRRTTYRSTSDSPTLGGPSANGPAAAASIRSRQPSFRDLINKFNNTSDQLLPLPSVSRSTSRTASPTGSVDGAERSRTLPRRRNLGDSPPPIAIPSNPQLQLDPTPSSLEVEQLASHPLNTNPIVPPPLFQRIPQSPSRRPLFGELLSVNTQVNDNVRLGIPSQLRRRGSDGSIPSPNPSFINASNSASARSPLTPTAWYLGQTSSLEAVESVGDHTEHHRRARSDLSGNPLEESLAAPWNPEMAVSAPLQLAKPGDGSPASPNSRSRIPVSSHRLTSGSGSEPSSPSANHTFGNRSNPIPLPPKGTSRLPKPLPKDSPPRMTENVPASFAMTARGRRDMTIDRTRNQVPERSRLLQAYIAAPPPKKSPPLRSSRPRQPVSHGASTSPRSKIGDRISSFQKSADLEAEAPSPRTRQRRLPELGNVDFATRRQRIQQAFNRTVQENERKEEEAAQLRRRREQNRAGPKPPADEGSPRRTTGTVTSLPADMTTMVAESTAAPGGGNNNKKDDHNAPSTVPQLHLNTAVNGSEDNVPRTTMDSPTLGLPDMKDRELPPLPHERTAVNNVAPNSAVTAGSDDTHVTTFDPDPQSDLLERRPSASHRTLLNHIMQIRESSSSSDSCDEPDCSMSETDDKESIQIMLRESTYFHSDSSTDTEEPDQVRFQQSQPTSQAINPPQNRWSMSSWSSSLRNQNSTCDEQCNESGDDMILQMSTTGQEIDPAAQSCSASSASPPSSAGDDGDTPIQDLGLMGPDTLEASPNLSSAVFSTPPSLARLGRWDSRRVTQLYLEELTRGRGANLGFAPIRSPEPRPTEHTTRGDSRNNSLTDDPVLVSRPEDIPAVDRLAHTASLVGRDDWEHASPSIMDWMQIAAEDEVESLNSSHRAFGSDNASTPRLPKSVAEFAQADSGLGLSFNTGVQNDHRSPVAGFPDESNKESAVPQMGQYQQVLSNPLPSSGAAIHSTRSSEDSSFRRLEPTQSSQAADSSATSLAPSAEHPVPIEPKKSPSPEQRRMKKRRHVIKELVDTEYTFGKDMKVVDDIYRGTSGSCLDISVDDVRVLFANSDQIVQFSMTFQDALKTAARSVYIMPRSQRWGSKRNNRPGSLGTDEQLAADAGKSDLEKDRATRIGEAFIANIPQMEIVYTDYLRNHDAANKKLQALQRNPKVAIWLKECREWASDLTSAWDLDSLLVKPVQRILKYPLLLTELLDATPADHPDHAQLAKALAEVTSVSVRINEMKKRADLVDQIVGRKRNQSDVRAGLSKAFGRRTEKFRQQVGISDDVNDERYIAMLGMFHERYFQLQLVMRDTRFYTQQIRRTMEQLNDFVASIEGILDVSQSNYPELESKWRRLKLSVQDILKTALPEHVDMVVQTVVDPMVALLSLFNGPTRVIKKRDKRRSDYTKYKAVTDRGDKPDKRTIEQGEQFIALNETLKHELPRMHALSSKLMEACLKNFVQIQTTWWRVLQKKLAPHVESFPEDLQKVISDWNSDYTFSEAQLLSLGVCNGALLTDTVNLVNFNTPTTDTNVNSPRRPSTVNSSTHRPGSMVEDSPKVSHEYGVGQLFQSPQIGRNSQSSLSRQRAESSLSGRPLPDTPDVGRSQLLQQVTNSSAGSTSHASKPTEDDTLPVLPQLTLDTPFLADVMGLPSNDSNNPPTSPAGRYSGFFSSALPMPDTPIDNQPTHNNDTHTSKEPRVLFLAASIYEFNIDRSRREAGYPYLTYVAGEIFDIIGEKGELWLARNQDDATHLVGWIWSKHFARLSS